MFLLDANILVYAFRVDTSQHAATRRWLDVALEGASPVATTMLVELAMLRFATLASLGRSVPIAAAFDFLAHIHARPAAKRIAPGDRHAALFEDLCRTHALRGNDVYDAYLAALAFEHRATLVTHDRGFARFLDLATFDPVAVAGLHEAAPAPHAAKRRRVSRSARP